MHGSRRAPRCIPGDDFDPLQETGVGWEVSFWVHSCRCQAFESHWHRHTNRQPDQKGVTVLPVVRPHYRRRESTRCGVIGTDHVQTTRTTCPVGSSTVLSVQPMPAPCSKLPPLNLQGITFELQLVRLAVRSCSPSQLHGMPLAAAAALAKQPAHILSAVGADQRVQGHPQDALPAALPVPGPQRRHHQPRPLRLHQVAPRLLVLLARRSAAPSPISQVLVASS